MEGNELKPAWMKCNQNQTIACIALGFLKCKYAVWDVNQIEDSQNSCLVQNKLEKWSMVE